MNNSVHRHQNINHHHFSRPKHHHHHYNHQQGLYNRITCRKCETIFYPPIFICVNGHSLCPKCLSQAIQCVECSGQITSRRNVSAEELYNELTVPCKNCDVGCTFKAPGRSMRHHNDVCDVAFKPCPVPGCTWRGDLTALTKHFLVAHKPHNF